MEESLNFLDSDRDLWRNSVSVQEHKLVDINDRCKSMDESVFFFLQNKSVSPEAISHKFKNCYPCFPVKHLCTIKLGSDNINRCWRNPKACRIVHAAVIADNNATVFGNQRIACPLPSCQ